MKYKIAAVVILLTLIIGLGVAEQFIIKDTMDEMLSRLDSFIVEEDEVYDLDEIKATGEWWDRRHKVLELFLPHNQILEITITFGELIGAVGAEDFDSAQALLTRIRMTCREFETVYSVRIGNII